MQLSRFVVFDHWGSHQLVQIFSADIRRRLRPGVRETHVVCRREELFGPTAKLGPIADCVYVTVNVAWKILSLAGMLWGDASFSLLALVHSRSIGFQRIFWSRTFR